MKLLLSFLLAFALVGDASAQLITPFPKSVVNISTMYVWEKKGNERVPDSILYKLVKREYFKGVHWANIDPLYVVNGIKWEAGYHCMNLMQMKYITSIGVMQPDTAIVIYGKVGEAGVVFIKYDYNQALFDYKPYLNIQDTPHIVNRLPITNPLLVIQVSASSTWYYLHAKEACAVFGDLGKNGAYIAEPKKGVGIALKTQQ